MKYMAVNQIFFHPGMAILHEKTIFHDLIPKSGFTIYK